MKTPAIGLNWRKSRNNCPKTGHSQWKSHEWWCSKFNAIIPTSFSCYFPAICWSVIPTSHNIFNVCGFTYHILRDIYIANPASFTLTRLWCGGFSVGSWESSLMPTWDLFANVSTECFSYHQGCFNWILQALMMTEAFSETLILMVTETLSWNIVKKLFFFWS